MIDFLHECMSPIIDLKSLYRAYQIFRSNYSTGLPTIETPFLMLQAHEMHIEVHYYAPPISQQIIP